MKVWNHTKDKLVSALALCSSPRLRAPYCIPPSHPSLPASLELSQPSLSRALTVSPVVSRVGVWSGGGEQGLWGALPANLSFWVWVPGKAGLPLLGPHCPHPKNQDNNDISSKTALEYVPFVWQSDFNRDFQKHSHHCLGMRTQVDRAC